MTNTMINALSSYNNNYETCELTIKFQVQKECTSETIKEVMAQCEQLMAMLRENNIDIMQFRLGKCDIGNISDISPDKRPRSLTPFSTLI